MKPQRPHFIFFLLFFWTASLPAQDLLHNIQYFDTENGLTGRTVLCTIEDDQGFIWVGTSTGLSKFDGQHFKPIGENNVHLTGFIKNLAKDEKGRLFVQTLSRLVVLNPVTEEPIEFPGIADGFWFGALLLNSGEQSQIRFITTSGKTYSINDQGECIYLSSVNPTKKELIKVSEWGTLYYIDRSKGQLVELDEEGNIIREKAIDPIFETLYINPHKYRFPLRSEELSNGLSPFDFIPIEDEENLYKYFKLYKDGAPFDLTRYSQVLPYNLILFIKKNNVYYLMVNWDIFLFDKSGNLIYHIPVHELEEQVSKLGPVRQLSVDRANRLWVSTENGLFLIHIKKSSFKNYYNDNSNTSVRGIIEIPNNRLVASTYSGTKIFDKSTKEEISSITEFGLGLYLSPDNKVFISQHGPQILQLDLDDDLSQTTIPTGREMVETYTSLFDSISQEYLLGTSAGLYYKEIATDSFLPYKKLNRFEQLKEAKLIHFHPNLEGIWIVTNIGLFLLDHQKGIVRYEKMNFGNLRHLHEDERGNFWIATAGGGLIHWDRKSNIKKQFTTEDGLSHNTTYAVYGDKKGFLWISSNKGLMRFDKKSHEVVVFQEEYGISHEEFNTHSHYKGTDGRLYFGGLNGITSFIPEEVIPVENNAALVVTHFHTFDTDEGVLLDRKQALIEQEKITLKAGDKFFTIAIELLDFYWKPHLFAWRIRGLDDNWTYQKEPTIRINTLKSGKYTLEIKAKGEGGTWAKNELSIPIEVLKPFYLRWPFLLGCALFVIFTALSIFYARLKASKKRELNLQKVVAERTAELSEKTEELSDKNQELEELNQFKDKIYAIIAHDLRGPTSALQGLGTKIDYLIKTNQWDRLRDFGKTIDEPITELNNLLSNLLNWADKNLNTVFLRPEYQYIEPLIDQVLKTLKMVSAKKSIAIEIDLEKELMIYADQQTTLSIIRNLLSNAIKFSPPNGRIEIKSILKNSFVHIQVIDHGVGIEPEKLNSIFERIKQKSTLGTAGETGTGLGLTISKELALLNGGDILVSSEVNRGSTFTLELPAVVPELAREP